MTKRQTKKEMDAQDENSRAEEFGSLTPLKWEKARRKKKLSKHSVSCRNYMEFSVFVLLCRCLCCVYTDMDTLSLSFTVQKIMQLHISLGIDSYWVVGLLRLVHSGCNVDTCVMITHWHGHVHKCSFILTVIRWQKWSVPGPKLIHCHCCIPMEQFINGY